MEMGSIKNSIIVCAFNEEKHILPCLDSIKKDIQGRSDTELIVVDNESSDLTKRNILNFISKNNNSLRVEYLRIKHVPLTSSRNTAISYSKGEYIVFVDADAVVREGWLENLLKEFKANVSIVAGNVENLHSEKTFSNFIYNSHYKCSLELGSKIVGANMAFRKKVFESVGGFFYLDESRGDETFLASEYFKKHTEEELGYAKKSIVCNDFPDGLLWWLKEQISGGKSYISIQKIVDKYFFIRPHIFLRIVSITFFPHLLFGMFSPLSTFIIFHFILFLFRFFYKIRYLVCGIRLLYFKQGFVQSVGFIPVAILGMLSVDFGCVIKFLSIGKGNRKSIAKLSVIVDRAKTDYIIGEKNV